jgi:predicted lipoprotein with Yx(FWY)xxD motif
MVACNDAAGGITLPDQNAAGHSGKTSKGGAGGSELEGQAGQVPQETGGTTVAGSAGTANVSAGSGGSHTHASSGGTKSTGSGGTGNTGQGNHDTAGEGGDANGEAGSSGETGAGGEGGTPETGAGGSGAAGGGGMAGTTAGGMGGIGGVGGTGDIIEPACIFHSDPVVDLGGVGGMPQQHAVAVGTNAFVGPYLTDSAGLTLYIYGADFPGDCANPPVSNCTADCTQAWPVFNANERGLPSTLDDANFGTLDRGDGTHQTTYFGWPLYYYKSDTAANVINGQGKSKTWFAAEVVLPNVMIMKGPTAGGGIKFLGDDRGRTLYSIPGDVPGSSSESPVSNCTGVCMDSFKPFSPSDTFPVTTLEPHDVSLFLRGDGHLQAAYKGVPLYFSKSDLRSGDELGVGVLGGALVLP